MSPNPDAAAGSPPLRTGSADIAGAAPAPASAATGDGARIAPGARERWFRRTRSRRRTRSLRYTRRPVGLRCRRNRREAGARRTAPPASP